MCPIPRPHLLDPGLGTGRTTEQARWREYLAVRETVLALRPDRVEEVHAPDERVASGVRPNLLVVFNGKDLSRTLWILTHIDVVPPGEMKLWDHDPFEPRVENGFLMDEGWKIMVKHLPPVFSPLEQ